MVAPLTHDPMFWGLNSADTGNEREKITKYIKIPIYLLVSEVFNLFPPEKNHFAWIVQTPPFLAVVMI